MATTTILPKNAGWLNLNELRNYPLHEGVTRTGYLDAALTADAGMALDNSILVDFRAVISGTSRIQLYIKEISVARGYVSLVIGGFNTNTNIITRKLIQTLYDAASLDVFDVFTGSGNQSADIYTAVQLDPVDGWGASTARVVLGRYNPQLPDGLFYFKPYQTWIEPCQVVAGPDSITRLSVRDRAGNLVELSGDVKITAGSNTTVGVNSDDNSIVFSAIPGQGYINGCDNLNVVRTVNGIAVEHVMILDDNNCVEVVTDKGEGTITITDKCSTPCCGCDELEAVVDQLRELQNRVGLTSGIADKLEDAIISINNTISRLPRETSDARPS